MGTKASDLETFPLCCARPDKLGCHLQFDLCLGIEKAERRELTTLYIERMQAIARKAGRKEFAE